MSWRSDSTPLVAGRWVSSAYAGRGVRGALIPATGLTGPAIPYTGLNLPAETDDEFQCVILTVPAGLSSFSVTEEGVVEAAGPDGTYLGTWRGLKNGASYGPDPSTYTFNIGAGSGALSGAATLDGPSVGGSLGGGAPSALSGGATLDSPSAGGGLTGGTPSDLGGGATLDGPTAGGLVVGGGPALPPLILTSTMPRLVRAGRLVPRWLAPLDVDEVADIYFDFTPRITGDDFVQLVDFTCEARAGTDPVASSMARGLPVFDATRAVQRIEPGVPGVIYLVRAVATLASGLKVPAAGFIRVRRLS